MKYCILAFSLATSTAVYAQPAVVSGPVDIPQQVKQAAQTIDAQRQLQTRLLPISGSLDAATQAGTDKDGVPVVDLHGTIIETTDPKALAAARKLGLGIVPAQRMIKVGDKQMPLQEFFLTYCQGKSQNETCARAKTILRIDSFSGPIKSLPKGL